jgi:hypothetical protein
MAKTLEKLVIDRAKWGKGVLLNKDDGTMCCLGFASLACGVPVAKLNYLNGTNKGFPDHEWDIPEWMKNGNHDGAPASARRQAVLINDSHTLTNAEKEEQLIKLFAAQGTELSFTGEYRNV